MKNKIIFIPQSNLKEFQYSNKPKPAKNFLPIWWKKNNFFEENDNGEKLIPPSTTFKGCMPFLDSLTTGYMAYTTQELYVSNNDNNLTINWPNSPEPLVLRKTKTDGLPVPPGCNEMHFAWYFNYGLLLPKGYSALFTHPLNRYDLPFISSSGIIDEECLWPGKFSFWLKNDFEGIIPRETPIIQIIPFKRENWISEVRPDLIDYAEKKLYERNNYFYGFYKKFIKQEKFFE